MNLDSIQQVKIKAPSRVRKIQQALAAAKGNESNNVTQTKCGRDYVKEYVEKEKQNMLKPEEKQNDFDDVSLFTESISGSAKSDKTTYNREIERLQRTYDLSKHKVNNHLSIMSKKKEIVNLIETNPVVVIQGPTGCGKTTQVPLFIFDNEMNKREHCNIIVTQPRRIAAISIAKRICAERDWPLGTLIGYKIGMTNCTTPDTRITFCTAGILLRMLINKKHLLDFTHIILDEVHERNQETDFLLIVIRKLLWMNSRSVKIILMSATINSEKFANYFASPINGNLVAAPVIEITKRSSFNINKFYIDDLKHLGNIPKIDFEEAKVNPNLYEFCARLIIAFDDIDENEVDINPDKLANQWRHVVLIFLPGIWEIEELQYVLQSPKYESCKWDVMVLHSIITNEEQQRVFDSPPADYRRIILSTNIAESSITVPNVKYVIDFCLTKILTVDIGSNLQCLELTWASKANCEQRAGRTGRVMEGRVYRLVPKQMFEECFNDESSPEILRAPLEQLVLNAKILDLGEPKAILALSIDPPDLSNLSKTILILKECGALVNSTLVNNQEDGQMTRLGYLMAALPINIQIAKLIILAHVFGVLSDAIIIGACMSTKSMFSNPLKKKSETYDAKLKWSYGSWSDLIASMHAYKMWISEKQNRNINSKQAEKNWAARGFIQLKVMYEIQALVKEVTERLGREGIRAPMGYAEGMPEVDKALILKVIIAGAFYPNYFVSCLSGNQNEELARLKSSAGMDPLTTVYLRGWNIKHNGLLYVKRIQDIFEKCTRSSTRRICVTFDTSSRIYVTFPQSNFSMNEAFKCDIRSSDVNVNGKIPISVYKALRMRKDNDELAISVMNDADAMAYESQLGGTEPQNFVNDNVALRPKLPGIGVQKVQIQIKHVNDPSTFWAVLDTPDTIKKLQLMDKCCNDYNLTKEIDDDSIKIGSLVLAPHRNNYGMIKYYRGIVENFYLTQNKKVASIHLIDNGKRVDVAQSDLREFKIKNAATKIEAQAFQCVLVNVKPSLLRNINGQWTDGAFKEFIKLTSNSCLNAEIYSVVNNVVAVKLFCVQNSTTKCLNDELIKQGFASFKVETYLSCQNNEIRNKYDELSPTQIKFYEDLQYGASHKSLSYPDAPNLSKCPRRVYLSGPFSILEIQLMPLVITNCGKKIVIHNTSVNSILLDPNPEEFQSNLVVASNVTQSVNGSRLLLRNTTLMPNIRGLTVLLSLIFAPCIELRCNDLGNRYISAICGLGYYADTTKSIFPEHDIEVPFDVEIDLKDLVKINRLRHAINVGLQPIDDNEQYDKEVIHWQQKARDLLIELFERERKPMKTEKCEQFGHWGTLNKSKVLHMDHHVSLEFTVFPPHSAIDLNQIDPAVENKIKHLEDLHEMASSHPQNHNTDIVCDLCEVSLFGVQELRVHLSDEAHVQNVTKLIAILNLQMS